MVCGRISDVARQHQQVLRRRDPAGGVPVADTLQGVPGAKLLRLNIKPDARRRGCSLPLLCLVTHHNDDAAGRNLRLCRGDHMQQKSPAAHLVQHLGPGAAQTCAFACRHDDDAKPVVTRVHVLDATTNPRRSASMEYVRATCVSVSLGAWAQ